MPPSGPAPSPSLTPGSPIEIAKHRNTETYECSHHHQLQSRKIFFDALAKFLICAPLTPSAHEIPIEWIWCGIRRFQHIRRSTASTSEPHRNTHTSVRMWIANFNIAAGKSNRFSVSTNPNHEKEHKEENGRKKKLRMEIVCTSLEFKWNGRYSTHSICQMCVGLYAVRPRWALLLLAVCSDVYAKTMRFSHRTSERRMARWWKWERVEKHQVSAINAWIGKLLRSGLRMKMPRLYGDMEQNIRSDRISPNRKLQRHRNVHVSMSWACDCMGMGIRIASNRIEIKVLNSISWVCAECDQESLSWTQLRE